MAFSFFITHLMLSVLMTAMAVATKMSTKAYLHDPMT
jgi:hypothetical protein